MERIIIGILLCVIGMASGCATTKSNEAGTPVHASEHASNNFYSQSFLTTENQGDTSPEEEVEADELIKGILGSVLIVFYLLLLVAPLSTL